MSYSHEKNGKDDDIVISGFETGISPSPHKGIANIQNANIATEAGEVVASFGRVQATMTSTNAAGTLNYSSSGFVFLSIPGSTGAFKGMWITISGSSNTGQLPNGTYYVLNVTGSGVYQLATTFNGTALNTFGTGLTASFNLFRLVGGAIESATEPYFSGGVQYYRYYVLDNQGLVWVYDTFSDAFPSDNQQYWFLPDTSESYWGSDSAPSGLLVLMGTLMVFSGNKIWVKNTVTLGNAYVQMTNALLMSPSNTSNPHFGLTGHQGRGYYTDGSVIGSFFPNTSLLTSVGNVQSYAAWFVPSSTTALIQEIITGTIPSIGPNVGEPGFSRIPAVFFHATGATGPTALIANTVYYIEYSTANATFQVFAAITGGTALDIQTGSSGQQYYDTFWVVGTHAGAFGDTATMVFTPERLLLPYFEVSQCMCEVGNNIIVGAKGSVVYPWNQVDATPSGLINLPEANVQQLLNVNQMAYIFAGYKGNVYITDGSVASLVIKIPDYCAGVPGTPSSYIEPSFKWGGAAYVRGRVYFSVLDQTLFTQSSSQLKAGNCGGIWSFIPTQNLYIGQDTGIALRQENQSSYGTYNGYATVIIPFADQSMNLGPQFWSCWQDTITPNPNYGFDKTQTHPVGSIIIETDFLPVGTVLNKYTPKQIEYKLASPFVAGDSIAVNWRKDPTGIWHTAGNVITPDTATSLSGYFSANFQGAQWVQLQFILTPLAATSSSWTRFTEGRIR